MKSVKTPPTLDSLVDDILPTPHVPNGVLQHHSAREEDENAETVREKPKHNGNEKSNSFVGHPLEKVADLANGERQCYQNKTTVYMDLSPDISFALNAMASHKCPKGLIVSAILRQYILTHIDDMKKFLYNSRIQT